MRSDAASGALTVVTAAAATAAVGGAAAGTPGKRTPAGDGGGGGARGAGLPAWASIAGTILKEDPVVVETQALQVSAPQCVGAFGEEGGGGGGFFWAALGAS